MVVVFFVSRPARRMSSPVKRKRSHGFILFFFAKAFWRCSCVCYSEDMNAHTNIATVSRAWPK